jgi:hypothetical protein
MKGARMPDELWRGAVSLAGVVGVYATARGLRVDFGSLKRRVEGVSGERFVGVPEGFVELPPIDALDVSSSRGPEVELSGSDGAKLVIRLAPRQPVDVVALAEAFWRRGA